MDSERWKQVDSLLQAALERSPEARAQFLREACGGDQTLEAEVLSLLASQQEAGSFLESPAMEVAARDMAQEQNTIEAPVVLSGRTLSHYHIIEKLGGGGMGEVWKARDTRLNRFVALKLLPAARMSDPERKRRFVQEARTASALNHPNIITIYDIGRADGSDFIAMELVSGKALDRLIARKGLRLDEALHYAIQVADALAAAHAEGIVHRDLKPGNIMVAENGAVKVVDFGLAKLTEQGGSGELARTQTMAEAPQTDQGMIVGTVAYMSPEQAEGKKVDARTDIFSFGAVLYEMITGRRAFAGGSVVSILSAILRDQPQPAAEILPGLPRDLVRIMARCLQKDPNRRYQHAGDLKIDLQQVRDPSDSSDSGVAAGPIKGQTSLRWWTVTAAVACLAIAVGTGWWLHGPNPALPNWKLTRLTADAGLSGFPALSPDGKLVAYSSDHGLDGEQDLYVKQVSGGQPIRLTFDGAGNTTPDFSPDGSQIVFRSNKGGGGIYEIPALGGEARLLARGGLNPRFSPDGTQVAYWVGTDRVDVTVAGNGSVWVVPVPGGAPRRVGANFSTARYPIWSPDGKRLLLVGYTSPQAYQSADIDWWLVATDGDAALRTGFYQALMRAGFRAPVSAPKPALVPSAIPAHVPVPGCWSATTNTVVFSLSYGQNGDVGDLWEIGVSRRTGKVSGPPKRLTAGAISEVNPTCAPGGNIAFTSVETRTDIWSLAFDLNRGTLQGGLDRITSGPAWREYASLAADGRHVAFVSNQSGRNNIWVRDLATGKESLVAGSHFEQHYPLSNASGERIAFSSYEQDHRAVYVSTPGEVPEKLCEGCLEATDWSRDEKTLLMFGGSPYQITVLDVASHRQTQLLEHPNYNLLYGRFSPDNRWVSFTIRIDPVRARIAVAPLDEPKPIPESAWITIAETGVSDWANWSPDGKTLYFFSPRDGHSCLWGQRVDAQSRRPLGESFPVLHLHGRLSHQQGSSSGWSAAGGRIATVLAEDTGNIWMMSRSGTR